MALVNLTEMLAHARKNHYAIPAFDVCNYEMVRAVIDVCEEERSPAIFMLLKMDLDARGQKLLIDLIRSAAETATVPVCIHLDHATTFEDIVSCIECGATSVMYDGSCLPLEENIANTRRVVEYAHARGVTVEAELGHVGDAIPGCNEDGAAAKDPDPKDGLTQPEQVVRFVKETNVDCLAVAIGTAHGVYVSTPELQYDRLSEIEAVSGCPLVLHGGSGTPDAAVQKAISLGITKINIFSEVLAAMHAALRDKLTSIENMSTWPFFVWENARAEMRKVVRHKIRTFGSNGQCP
ncbi:MAG: class II fructose-bisphosphate aldolase [Clostridiales bacterium]|nr:class II fructose-bisphosphate aldolase [Clostridiales bacterium]